MGVAERLLRVMLWLLTLDAVIGSAVLLLGSRAVFTWLYSYAPASDVSDLLLFKQRQWGALGVALTIMLMAAARDPRRHSIIVWAIAVGIATAGLAELLSIWLVDAARLFPVSSFVGHGIARIGLALVLVYLQRRLLADRSE
jgi:hypothetical protein